MGLGTLGKNFAHPFSILDVFIKKITERNTRPPGIHWLFITKLLKFSKIPSGGILNLFLETPDSMQKE